MLRSAKELLGYKVTATDGDAGSAADIFFEDHDWYVVYLVVSSEGWISTRRVLVPRRLVGEPDFQGRRFPVKLPRQEVEDSPSVEADRPVSIQQEQDLLAYYNLQPGWIRGPISGFGMPEMTVPSGINDEETIQDQGQQGDAHLRSLEEVIGYRLETVDGDIGYVQDAMIDDSQFKIRYLVVDTEDKLDGRTILLAVPWVSELDWDRALVKTEFSIEQIKQSPQWDGESPIERPYEEALHTYYGRPRYWAS
ncbi:hypothetical protein GF356_10860 [candidate division GN15 bacterium]|nr:hypothetical protein [candidate division GN15 bacterium]